MIDHFSSIPAVTGLDQAVRQFIMGNSNERFNAVFCQFIEYIVIKEKPRLVGFFLHPCRKNPRPVDRHAEDLKAHLRSQRNVFLTSSYAEYYKSVMTYERTHSTRKISPFSIPRIMPSSAVANLSLVYKIGGESYDVSCACTSGAVALIQAFRLIQSGAYDIVMAGGCEELSWQQALGFGAMHALSSNFNEEPEKASRPFDRQRTGFVLSEAAGIVILESEAHAKARGAKIRGRISG